MATIVKDEWLEQREKALYAILKKQNLKWKRGYTNEYLAEHPHASKQDVLRYLKSKLNCCGYWYGTYHAGKPHPKEGGL